VRTGETCDRAHRDADEIWRVGVLDTTTGKLIQDGAPPSTPAEAPAPAAPAPKKK